jgi:hypothetical protein
MRNRFLIETTYLRVFHMKENLSLFTTFRSKVLNCTAYEEILAFYSMASFARTMEQIQEMSSLFRRITHSVSSQGRGIYSVQYFDDNPSGDLVSVSNRLQMS